MCELPETWKERFHKWCHRNFKRPFLQFDDFADRIILAHRDGTVLVFRNALVMKESDGFLVMTEHCGYHIFPPDCGIVFPD